MKKILSPDNAHTLNEVFLDGELAVSAADNGEGRGIEETGNAYYMNRQTGYESNVRSYPLRLPAVGFEISSYALSS